MATKAEPVSHWHKSFSQFQTSPMDFFAAVQDAIGRRKVPDLKISRVEWRESGVGSARREYLRILRGDSTFDICAAPFGAGFFFSWWFVVGRPSSAGATIGALMLFLVLFWMSTWWLAPFLFLVVLAVLGMALGQGESPLALQFAGIPLIGPLWEKLFIPATYFRLDSRQMYLDSVHAAVIEVIDTLTEAEGLPRLTEDERKPVMKDFFGK